MVVLLEFKGQDYLEGIETILRATGGEVALLELLAVGSEKG